MKVKKFNKSLKISMLILNNINKMKQKTILVIE